jgi:hypothetical protein
MVQRWDATAHPDQVEVPIPLQRLVQAVLRWRNTRSTNRQPV